MMSQSGNAALSGDSNRRLFAEPPHAVEPRLIRQVKNQMKITVLAVPENVALVRVCVAAFASQLEFTLGEVNEIKVATSEAVSNVILHAYDSFGNVEVIASLDDEWLEVVVSDSGKGIEDVEEALQPTYTTDPDHMGLGFVFMESMMDRLDVQSAPGEGTVVWMAKRVAQG